MERYAVLLALLASAIALPSPQSSKQYREDYVYSQLTNAFFKLHTEETLYHKAKQVCVMEGAELMVPRSIQDVAEVHALFKEFPDIGDYVWVGDDGETHESAEDNAILFKFSEEETEYPPYYRTETKCVVITREGEIRDHICVYSRFPFVCKVDLASAPYDAQCEVYAKDYVYIGSVGSCYRVSKVAYSWNQAYAACQAERAHLLVLNSDAESEAVRGLLSTRTMLGDSYSPYYYIVGIRADKNDSTRTFRTIFNQTLPEAGFSKWADTEPNNQNGNEYCGSLYESDGKYNDQDCANAYAFICEKEKHS